MIKLDPSRSETVVNWCIPVEEADRRRFQAMVTEATNEIITAFNSKICPLAPLPIMITLLGVQ
ncbi:MAG: hypothetical protein NZO16_02850 [Deltaproteobacteria bacterium]|nr:hypothetical protein [Deltaproteobacteria bacterium]